MRAVIDRIERMTAMTTQLRLHPVMHRRQVFLCHQSPSDSPLVGYNDGQIPVLVGSLYCPGHSRQELEVIDSPDVVVRKPSVDNTIAIEEDRESWHECSLKLVISSHSIQQQSVLPVNSISFPASTYVLILGASSGFGAAAARECARHGLNIVGVHLDRGATMPAVQALQDELRSMDVEVCFHNVNAADANRRAEVLKAIQGLFADRPGATVRLLMHSLAFGALRPIYANDPRDELTPSQIDMTMNVMANSLLYWTRDLIHAGLMKRGGRIIAMTSSGSTRVLPAYGAVSAAKAALESYCRQLAYELGPHGITVNALQAGVTVTPALQKIPGSDHLIAHALERNPLGRLTTAEDVGRLIVPFLLDYGAWINGATIRVDGGEDIVDIDWTRREPS